MLIVMVHQKEFVLGLLNKILNHQDPSLMYSWLIALKNNSGAKQQEAIDDLVEEVDEIFEDYSPATPRKSKPTPGNLNEFWKNCIERSYL